MDGENATPQFYSPNSTTNSKRSKSKLLLFLAVAIILIVLVIFGTMKFLNTRDSAMDISPTPTIEQFTPPTDTPAPTSEEEATETPTPTSASPTVTRAPGSTVDKSTGLDRSKISIQVLNGSGTGGVAGTAKDYLEGLGYTVSGTGNADNFDYEETVIQVKSASKNYLPLLQKDLGSKYTVGSASATLSSGAADAVVIIGKK